MASDREAILLSGGMDSIALAYLRRPEVAITIDYGQLSAEAEVRAAREVAEALQLRHEIITVDCRALGSGDLAGRPALDAAPVSEWWPFRNQLLITLAAMRAVTLGIRRIVIGSVSTDTVHADGRSEFFRLADLLVAMQEGAIRVEAPAASLSSAELIALAGVPRRILCWAHSCHKAVVACGECRGCNKHREVTGILWGEENAY